MIRPGLMHDGLPTEVLDARIAWRSSDYARLAGAEKDGPLHRGQVAEMDWLVEPSRGRDLAARPQTGPRLAEEMDNRARTAGNPRQQRSYASEDKTAEVVAQHGFEIVQHPYVPEHHSRVIRGKGPDYRIEGKFFDNKHFETGRASTIARQIRQVFSNRESQAVQAQGVIADLTDSSVRADRLYQALEVAGVPGEVWVRNGDQLSRFWTPG